MTEKKEKHPRKKGSGRFFWVLLKHMVLAVLAVFIAGLFILLSIDWIIMPIILKSGSEITAPNLIGLKVDDAKNILRGVNFKLLQDSAEFNMDFPENTISFQYPGPGTKIKPGRRIRVIVSLGTRPISMPNVVGKSRRDAGYVIKALGFSLVKYEWVHSNEYLRGIVAGQYPEEGQEIPENIEVILSVSDGLPETKFVMPNLIELSYTAAMDSLKTYNFDISKVNIEREQTPELLPETVIDQHPDPGTPIHINSVIDLVISTSQ